VTEKGVFLRTAIRTLLALGAAMTAGTGLLQAQDQNPDAVSLLERARHQEDLRAAGSSPFQLRSQILIHGNRSQVQGEYRMVWESADRWAEKLTIGDFQRVRVGVSGGYRQARSVDYSPRVVFDFGQATGIRGHLRNSQGEILGKIRTRKIEGTALLCVEVKNQKDRAFRREVCIDPSTGLLARVELPGFSSPAPTERTVVEYSQFSNVLGKSYPQHIRLQRGRGFWLDISVVSLEKASEGAQQTQSWPENSEFWEDCDEETPGELVTRVNPQYPQVARSAGQQGTVSLYLIIEKDGSASNLRLVQSASSLLDSAAEEAVRQWKYRPPTCNGSPIRAETIVDVIFSMVR
jgi:TonB family protein